MPTDPMLEPNTPTVAVPSPTASPSRTKSTLILGLGNDILGDDAVGLLIVRELQRRLPPEADVEAVESNEMGLALLDLIVGYQRLVLVDSVKSGRAPVGAIHEVPLQDVEILPLMSPHFFGIGEILALGRQLGMPVPSEVRIQAIEVEDPFTVREALSPALEAVLPTLVQRIQEAAMARGTNALSSADAG